MNRVIMTIAAAIVLVAGPAFGQQQQQPQQGQQQQTQEQEAQRAYQATKHFAVVNAGIQDAKLNAKMLNEISSDPRSYDKEHGDLFVKNIQDSLREAQTHLQHLQPMATSEDERKQFQELSQNLQRATQMAQPMSQATAEANRISESSSKLQEELDKVESPLKELASSMDAKIEIG